MIEAARLLPVFLIVVATLICALPWGPPPEFRLVLPLLPYVVIHRCVERWGPATPDWLVFLAGFATDVAGQGPLGYWALIYLCGYTMIRSVTVLRYFLAGAERLGIDCAVQTGRCSSNCSGGRMRGLEHAYLLPFEQQLVPS